MNDYTDAELVDQKKRAEKNILPSHIWNSSIPSKSSIISSSEQRGECLLAKLLTKTIKGQHITSDHMQSNTVEQHIISDLQVEKGELNG